MGNDRLSGKQVGSQASRRVTRRLAWIQPVCLSINAVPALKGLMSLTLKIYPDLYPSAGWQYSIYDNAIYHHQ